MVQLTQRKQPPSGTIILDRPANHNALSREMVGELIQAFSDFHVERSVRAVILTASGKTFCSGVDLKQWHAISQEHEPYDEWREVASELQELIEVMLRFPKPIITAMDGAVYGMGIGLVLASDLVIASPQARFEFSACRYGLVSGLVAPLLTFRAGGGNASRLLLGGESIEGTEAHRIGLVHHLVPSELIWAKSHEMAQQIATAAPESIQQTKRLINEMVGESLITHLVSGAAMMATLCNTPTAVEGLAAFQEKRAPKFP